MKIRGYWITRGLDSQRRYYQKLPNGHSEVPSLLCPQQLWESFPLLLTYFRLLPVFNLTTSYSINHSSSPFPGQYKINCCLTDSFVAVFSKAKRKETHLICTYINLISVSPSTILQTLTQTPLLFGVHGNDHQATQRELQGVKGKCISQQSL